MAPADAGEPDYESDPEELKRSLTRRRREASDDDEDDDGELVKNQRAEIDSDQSDSDEQVDTVKFDNDENKSEDGEDSYEEEEEADEYKEHTVEVDDGKRSILMKAAEDAAVHVDPEEEKEKQSAAVPTGGAFYMHDDRFQEMSAGQSRYTLVSLSFAFLSFLNCSCFYREMID